MQDKAIMIVKIFSRKEVYDIEVPLDISANDFVIALNQAFQLGIDTNNILNCYLKTESPTALIRGNKLLRDYGLRNGTIIEQMYGKSVFYEDAANALIPDAYDKALEECEEQIVSSPKIDVTQLEAGKPFIFTAEVALKPEVTLGKYKENMTSILNRVRLP